MKSKLIRKFALLLALITFMTQVLHFPVKAAEISGGEIIDIEREAESGSIAGTEATIETDIAMDIETETMTDTESITSTEAETGIQTEEMEAETENVTVDETETTSEVETMTEEDAEHLEENKGASLSGISFSVTDIRDSSKTKVLNTDDGKQAVYLFGDLKDEKTFFSIEELLKSFEYFDKSKLSVFVFSVSSIDSDTLSSLNALEIPEDIMIGNGFESVSSHNFYRDCVYKEADSSAMGLPFIVYKGKSAEMYASTRGYQDQYDICKNIEADGLTAIKTDGGNEGNGESEENEGIKGISFSVTDIRDSSKTKVLNTDDGKQAVYLFGSIAGCGYTQAMIPILSKCMEYYDNDKINIFVFDNAGADKSKILSWLNTQNISKNIIISGVSCSNDVENFYNVCKKAIGYGNFDTAIPTILYKGVNGEVYKHTMGYQEQKEIYKNIGEGGLKSSIVEESFFAEGLVYVKSSVNYDTAYEILDLVNEERKKNGLEALTMDKDLLDAAMQRAAESSVYFSHVRPNGEMCHSACSKMSGENIAAGHRSAEAVMDGWMNSEGHRANILNSYYNSIGIGVSDVGGRLSYAQCFGRAASDEIQKPSNIASKTYEIRYVKAYLEPKLGKSSITICGENTYQIIIKPTGGFIYDEEFISCTSYKWSSGNESVATVDSAGVVKGVKSGKTTITGTNILNEKDILTLEVTVEEEKPNVTSVQLNETMLQLKENETFQLQAEVKADIYVNEVEWKTSNETVATVSENGLVTAKSEGTAVITATSYGKPAECIVKVSGATKPPKADIPTNTEVGKGTLVTLTSDTQGAVIRYTTDGSTPTEKSSIYNQPIAIYQDTTIKAYASSADSADSEVVTFVYTLKSFTVTFDTDGGTAISSLKVYQNDSIDEPDKPTKPEHHFAGWYLNGKPYDFNTPVTANITLKAVWREYEMLPSPKANFKTGMVIETGTRVALSHDIAGVSLYYTTDGSIPTEKSAEYKNAIVVKAETTIKAIAVKKGYKNSEVSVFHYTVAEKGSLWGDVSPEDIPSSGSIPEEMWVTGIKDATYTGKAVTHDIHVYDGSTLLVEKRDYTVSYKNNIKAAKKSDSKAPAVIISGKGNYKDKIVIPFNINQKDLSDSDVIADEMAIAYTGKMKKVVPVIRYRQKKLANNKDFVITNPIEYGDAGKYVIKVEGKGNYTGTRDITLMVTKDVLISKASVSKISDQTYDGKEKTPEITVKLKKTLEQDKDYTLTYVDNREIGTASVIIKGKGEYSGTKRISFRIISPYKGGKYDIGEDIEELVDVDIDSKVLFSKGGSTPAIKVSFNGKRLIQGKDYTVSFKNNKTAYSVSGKEASAIITGKGNYCGKIDKRFTIERKDISQTILAVSDAIYTGKSKGHQTKFVLTDVDGKALKAGTDYEKEIVYTYAKATELEIGESRTAGETVKDTDVVPVDTVINVTIKGTGSYEKTITGSYRVIAKEKNISKAKVTLKNPQYYTGSAVKPDKNQFEVKLGNTILNPDEYSIVCYTNNVKKGNASVTIRGEGIYGGTKTAKFLIGSKTVNNIEP